MTQAPPARQDRLWQAGLAALRDALGLFTVLPVRAAPEIGRREAARAVLWLPVVGTLLAVPAAGVLLAVEAGGHSAPRRLLAAALAIGVLALLTGGLHLDGLADTADGLGSRRPAIRPWRPRRSTWGRLVAALLFTVPVQIGWHGDRLAPPSCWPPSPASRVVLATGPGSPAARRVGRCGGNGPPGWRVRWWRRPGPRHGVGPGCRPAALPLLGLLAAELLPPRRLRRGRLDRRRVRCSDRGGRAPRRCWSRRWRARAGRAGPGRPAGAYRCRPWV
jgi:hypothetical protein